jgi:hypothetical protein
MLGQHRQQLSFASSPPQKATIGIVAALHGVSITPNLAEKTAQSFHRSIIGFIFQTRIDISGSLN